MRTTLFLLGIFLFFSCNQKTKSTENTNNISQINENQFDFLVGKWKRNNEEEGLETFENWAKISEIKYVGLGFTMQNGDTIKQEKIQIIKENNKWNLFVKVPEENNAITFEIIEIRQHKFVCVNDSLDFPKRIEYWKNGNTLNALVSGGNLEIPFEFKPK